MNQRSKHRDLIIKELTRFFDRESSGIVDASSKEARKDFENGLNALTDTILLKMVSDTRAAQKDRGKNFIRPPVTDGHQQPDQAVKHLNSEDKRVVEPQPSVITQAESKRQQPVIATYQIDEEALFNVDNTLEKKSQPISILELLSNFVALISEKFANMYFDLLKQMVGIQDFTASEAVPYIARSDYRSTYGALRKMLPQSFTLLEMSPLPVISISPTAAPALQNRGGEEVTAAQAMSVVLPDAQTTSRKLQP
ncbi:MAG: hypothetical protein ABI597_04865 [Gammaproteobacteria bacterium]